MRWPVLRLWLATGMYVSSAWATTLPERPSPANMECVKVYPFIAGHAPTVSIVDPNTGIALCNGLVLPTSLVGYYVQVESWSELAAVEIETLKAERPTFWSKWGERAQFIGIGMTVGVATGLALSR